MYVGFATRGAQIRLRPRKRFVLSFHPRSSLSSRVMGRRTLRFNECSQGKRRGIRLADYRRRTPLCSLVLRRWCSVQKLGGARASSSKRHSFENPAPALDKRKHVGRRVGLKKKPPLGAQQHLAPEVYSVASRRMTSGPRGPQRLQFRAIGTAGGRLAHDAAPAARWAALPHGAHPARASAPPRLRCIPLPTAADTLLLDGTRPPGSGPVLHRRLQHRTEVPR